jgi:hypothetical protein
MQKRKTIVKLFNLPVRPRPLNDKDLNNVFGGCQTSGGCRDIWGNADPCICCPEYTCKITTEPVYKKNGDAAGFVTESECVKK